MAVGAVHSGGNAPVSKGNIHHDSEQPIKKKQKPLFEERGSSFMANLSPTQKNVSVFC